MKRGAAPGNGGNRGGGAERADVCTKALAPLAWECRISAGRSDETERLNLLAAVISLIASLVWFVMGQNATGLLWLACSLIWLALAIARFREKATAGSGSCDDSGPLSGCRIAFCVASWSFLPPAGLLGRTFYPKMYLPVPVHAGGTALGTDRRARGVPVVADPVNLGPKQCPKRVQTPFTHQDRTMSQ
jgi:hypothetical protein